MKFLYTATTKDGRKQRSTLEAPSRQAAVRQLKERRLTVTSIAVEETPTMISLGVVSTLSKVMLTKHLAIMLRAGISLDEALRILQVQSSGRLRTVLGGVLRDVSSGMRLADALARYPHVFNSYYVNMVRAGEESGNLSENLEQLSSRYGKDYELRQKAQGAMLYPALVLALTGGLGMVISLFVLPRLTGLFRAFDFELPWYTKAMVWVSQFVVGNALVVAVVLIVGTTGFLWVIRQPFAAPVVHRAWLYLPIVRDISRTLNLARFSLVFASLLKSGIPITAAVEITSNVLGNVAYRDVLHKAVARVETGEPLSTILSESSLFPPFVTRMILIGEQTGKLEDMLMYLGEFYETQLDSKLKNLSTILEPALLIFIGLVVAFVALSIISPIYNFIGEIG